MTAPPSRPSTAAIIALSGLVLAVVVGLFLGAVAMGRGGDSSASDVEPSTTPTATSDGATRDPTGAPSSEPPVDPDEPPPTAGEVADRFLAAVLSGDCATVDSLSTGDFLAEEGGCAEADIGGLQGYEHAIDDVDEYGDDATVEAFLTAPPDGSATPDPSTTPVPVFTITLDLVNTGAGWQVDDLAARS